MAKMSQEKRDELEEVLGEDLAVQIIDQIDASAEALKQAGVRSKEAAAASNGASSPRASSPPDGADGAEQAADAPAAPPQADAGQVAKEALVAAANAGDELEFVLTPDAMKEMAKEAAALVSVQLSDLAAQLKATLDGLTGLRAAVEKNAQDVLLLQQADEAKIAEKVANLPRATVRRIQAPEIYRATQKEATAPDEAEATGDFLSRLKHIVHD